MFYLFFYVLYVFLISVQLQQHDFGWEFVNSTSENS